MFWTNEKLIMVAWSSSFVSISCFEVQSSLGHLVWFFDSRNSIVSVENSGCPWSKRTNLLQLLHSVRKRWHWTVVFSSRRGPQSLERTTHNKHSFLTLSPSSERYYKIGYNLTLIANSDLIRRWGSHISSEVLLIQVCFYVIQQNSFDDSPLLPKFPSNCLTVISNLKL